MSDPTDPPTPAKRTSSRIRRLILTATVGGAAAAGGGAFWAWRSTPGSAAGAGSPGNDRLWTLQFERPEGGSLDMSSLRGRPWVLNFWATWCPPCVDELPELNRFHTQWSPKGWQVIGLAVDSPSAVRQFLTRQPLGFPIGLAGLEGASLSRELGNAQGGLPFTAVFAADGRVRQTKAGATHLAELSDWARQI